MEKREFNSKKSRDLAREQYENEQYSRMLIWIVAGIVLEVVVLALNRFYIHTRVSELESVVGLDRLLGVSLILGIVLFAVCLFWSKKEKAAGRKGFLPVVLGTIFLIAGCIGFTIKMFGASIIPMEMVGVPVLTVLMLVFYIYPREFFAGGVMGAICIFGLWGHRASMSHAHYLMYAVALIVIMAVAAACAMSLKKNEGRMTIGGKERQVLGKKAAYNWFLATEVVALVLMLLPLAVSAAAYYGIWVMAAWLIILAVYFTSKLM